MPKERHLLARKISTDWRRDDDAIGGVSLEFPSSRIWINQIGQGATSTSRD